MGCIHCGHRDAISDQLPTDVSCNYTTSINKLSKMESFANSSVPVIRRLVGEIAETKKSGYMQEFQIVVNDDSLTHWAAVILGPLETPYENGRFVVDLIFPSKYPFEPPKVTFRTPIFHPNVSTNGAICLDILKPNSGTWSPLITVPTLLLSIQSLLSDPNPEDPLNLVAADMYQRDIDRFNATAKRETAKYTGTSRKSVPTDHFAHLQIDAGHFVDEEEAMSRALSNSINKG